MNIDDFKIHYDVLKDLVDKIKKTLLDVDTSSVVFDNKIDNKKCAIRINKSFFDSYFAIEIFNSKIGRFFLQEEIENDLSMVKRFSFDSIVFMLLPSNAITIEEGKLIHSLGHKIKRENNLLIYKYRYGKGRIIPTEKELEYSYTLLEFMASFVKNEYDTILEAVSSSAHIETKVDTKNYSYSDNYLYRLNYEYPYKLAPKSIDFINEFKDSVYSGETFLFSTFYPVVIKENGVRPLILTFIDDGYSINTRYITSSVNTYNEYIFGILDDVFSNLGKLPEKILLDNDLIYSLIKNTLEELHVEVELVQAPSSFITKTMMENNVDAKKPGSFDLDSDIQSKENVEQFLNYIVSDIKNVNVEELPMIYESLKDEELDDDYDDLDDFDVKDDKDKLVS